ncbi:hypothetical protein ACFWHT_11600 [Microbacterium sp. NPDC058342]|uniref:hypothetical protein n=1 Tax=Microbacterium sp. NPDC058342 TaxID=3346454 RepID=UPI00365F6766
MTSSWKRVAPWAATSVLLAAAWGVNTVTPPEDVIQDGMIVAGRAGEPVMTRNLVVTVEDVRAARAVADPAGWSADGAWVIVDLHASSVDDQLGTTLALAELTVGERTFRATERAESLYRKPLVPGVARQGSVAFEVPPDALSGPGVLRFSLASEPQMDGVIEIPIDLDDVAVEQRTTLLETGWAEKTEP